MVCKSAGRHLIIDGILSEESLSIVSSTEMMAKYLEDITEITGMTLVLPPISMSFPFAGETRRLIKRLEEEGTTSPVIEEFKSFIKDRDEHKGGVSAITVWLESHASLHSWVEDYYISIDLYSCKEFDIYPVLKYTSEFMKLKDMNILKIDRKMNAPAIVEQVQLLEI
jgi:S-adenosylmethionine decarboxylase